MFHYGDHKSQPSDRIFCCFHLIISRNQKPAADPKCPGFCSCQVTWRSCVRGAAVGDDVSLTETWHMSLPRSEKDRHCMELVTSFDCNSCNYSKNSTSSTLLYCFNCTVAHSMILMSWNFVILYYSFITHAVLCCIVVTIIGMAGTLFKLV
jgi:hypothetical protein